MRWSGDYSAKIEKETPKAWQLMLEANKKGLTYDKIRAWIAKKNYRPIKAEYMTKTGRKIKYIEFQKFKKWQSHSAGGDVNN